MLFSWDLRQVVGTLGKLLVGTLGNLTGFYPSDGDNSIYFHKFFLLFWDYTNDALDCSALRAYS